MLRRTEDARGAGHVECEIEGGAECGLYFDAWGEGSGGFEQGCFCRAFFRFRAAQDVQAGEGVELGAGHGGGNAQPERGGVGADDLLEWRVAGDDGHGGAREFGAQAQQGLGGKLGDVDGEEEGVHGLVGVVEEEQIRRFWLRQNDESFATAAD